MLDVAAQEGVHLLHLGNVLELVEDDHRARAAAVRDADREVEQRVEGGERVDLRVDLELRAHAVGAEREPEPRALEEFLDPRAQLALELSRVRPLDPHGHVRDREHAVQIDQNRDQALAALAVPQHSPEQARLAVFARCHETDEVAADGPLQQLVRFLVPVDHLVGRDRTRVHEGVDVGNHCRSPRRIPDGLP